MEREINYFSAINRQIPQIQIRSMFPAESTGVCRYLLIQTDPIPSKLISLLKEFRQVITKYYAKFPPTEQPEVFDLLDKIEKLYFFIFYKGALTLSWMTSSSWLSGATQTYLTPARMIKLRPLFRSTLNLLTSIANTSTTASIISGLDSSPGPLLHISLYSISH